MLDGDTLNEETVKLIAALPVFDESATLVAITVTACALEMLEGAVYNPADEIVPTAGLNDHVTAVFVVPVTVAENCCVLEALKVTVAGLTDTAIELVDGITVTSALPVVLFVLVATTEIVC